MNITQLRKENKKTQEEIAKELNLSVTGYSYYETGKREPSIETLIKLADYYGVSLDYLVGRNYANELGYLTSEQKAIIKMFMKLDEYKQTKVAGYIAGLEASK